MPLHDPQRAVFLPVLVPLGTTVPRSRRPYATWTLIGLTLAFFLAGLSSQGLVDGLAFFVQDRWYRHVSYAFVHEPTLTGTGHVFFNMLFLWIFAAPLESRSGPWRLVALYLAGAVAGSLSWSALQGVPKEPLLGSSAAVWAVVAAYLVLWPTSSVKFFFTILLLVTPIYARAWKMWALVFAAFYYLALGGLAWLAWFFDFKPVVGQVAWSAHLGGIATGIALTAAALALKHSNAETTDFVPEPAASAPAAKPAPPKPDPAAPAPPQWLPLHEAVIMGDRAAAIRIWRERMKPQPDACLMPGPQLDLARMLAREGRDDDAIEALDRLLRLHANCDLTALARIELAKILTDRGRNPERVAALLEQVETGNPSADLLAQVEEMRGRFKGPQAAAPKVRIEADDLPTVEVLPEEPDTPQQVSVLFGDVEDTDAFGVKLGKEEPPPPKPGFEDTTPPSEIASELAVFGTANPEAAPRPSDAAFKPHASVLKSESAARQDDEPFFNRQSILPRHETHDAPPRVVDESLESGGVQSFNSPRRNAYVALDMLDELDKAHVPRPEIFIGDITQYPYKPDSDETKELPLVLRPTLRYAAILTPGQPVDIQLVCSTLAPLLGLGPDPTHHALLRRRGILIEDLIAAEAEALARTLASAGQSVSLVAMDRTLDFGPPLDVLTYGDDGAAGRFSVAGQALVCRWSQAVCFAAGLVRLEPTAPGRAVLDLFFSQPRVHLRLWESTMVYPDRIAATARVLETIYAQAPTQAGKLPLRRDWCFRALANEISDHGKNAIRTRSLSDWIEQAMALPTAHFWSPIEYDNFLRWHLMAYYAPKKVYG